MESKKTDPIERAFNICQTLLQPIQEVIVGILSNRLPWKECFLTGICFMVGSRFQIDLLVFERLGIAVLYPKRPLLFWSYFTLWSFSGFWFWGIYQTGLRKKLIRNLTQLLTEAGLKTNMGRLPGYIFDKPIDECTRRLRLSKLGIPIERFKAAKSSIASGLQVYIDDINEDITKGTVDFLYSHLPMPAQTEITHINSIAKGSFMIGKTRTKEIETNFKKTPHLLVAGQTGGGKSTFLIQVITTLYSNCRNIDFTLIDFKRGVELGVFEKLKRVSVLSQMKEVVRELEFVERELTDRMDLFRTNNVKDLESYNCLTREKIVALPKKSVPFPIARRVLVIDEAAELFLAGDRTETKDVQNIRRTVSQIARLGRGVGIHLIIATQRPDSRALDPQVKANLTGVLCFQMVNDASSISVLGNGRATDLPPIAGRAIWKSGLEMVEVQTPILLNLTEILKSLHAMEEGKNG